MSSGEGVSKQNGIIGSTSVGVVLGLPAHCLVFPDKIFLFVQSKCFLRLRKDRVMANSEGSAKTDKSSPRPTRDEEGEGRFMSELRCPSPCSCDWEISTLRSIEANLSDNLPCAQREVLGTDCSFLVERQCRAKVEEEIQQNEQEGYQTDLK